MIPNKTLKINDKEYPFHFGMGALRLFAIKTDKGEYNIDNIEQLITQAELKDFDTLIWCGLKSGAAKAGEQLDLTPEDLTDVFNENPIVYENAISFINEMQGSVQESKQVAEEELGN